MSDTMIQPNEDLIKNHLKDLVRSLKLPSSSVISAVSVL